MLFEKTYGIDLGSSSVKVYSMIRNKSYIEKNMIAAKGRKIIAVGNEAYEMFEKAPSDISVSSCQYRGEFADGFWYDSQSGTAGNCTLQYDEKN